MAKVKVLRCLPLQTQLLN